ncbi:hypothetical protein CROQUDRAFT_467435 [Cronartium quercuum f. sp. fusiforme G11]|uniref:C2H2-type domain-containing protein n=1 Tax=Cronartium quercuum f. sp. fusiforme G11 TaxID=708437 RepID=A0A9P6NWS9_9BASI|nr:hypothetical protein CROQUDRAFT_467435 [Cronartium quercuum f. sp. fusiforme G11]
MTAPGAGWDAGKFNHDYDYTSASVGLYGNSAYQFSSPDITTPTPTSTSTILTHQTEPSPTSASSDQLLSLFPSFAPPASSIRPNTHAGTQLSFSDRPQSSYNQTQSNSSSYELWRPNLNGLGIDQCHPSDSLIGSDRPYQFNLLPGAPRKRARRRFDEVERLYQCNYPGCTKAYGTLNHLNAHICMQKHGPKRLPQEFKEIRKEWRAKKKAEAEARNAGLVNNRSGNCWNGPSISSNITTTTT